MEEIASLDNDSASSAHQAMRDAQKVHRIFTDRAISASQAPNILRVFGVKITH